MAGIYIHIPFCEKACHYCDFHFTVNLSGIEEIVQGIAKEISVKELGSEEKIETLYFGGGTPSILNEAQLESILLALGKRFDLKGLKEFTLEANPEHLILSKVRSLKALGVNRISLGIQSFNDEVLRKLNRNHGSAQALRAIEAVYSGGIENLSIDQIFGIPFNDKKGFEEDLRTFSSIDSEHISAYSLTIEQGTKFGLDQKKGQIKVLDDEQYLDQFLAIHETLDAKGMNHYEISNYAKPGKEAIHNTSYWEGHSYYGFGPSAHSYNGKERSWNISKNGSYLQSLDKGNIPQNSEFLNMVDMANERLMTGLRTKKGIDMMEFRQEFGVDLFQSHSKFFQELEKQKLIQIERNNLRMTLIGWFQSDEIVSHLFLEK